jgi:hypothetical protein
MVTDPRYLLFPWIAVLAYQDDWTSTRESSHSVAGVDAPGPSGLHRPKTTNHLARYVCAMSWWFLTPVTMLILWGQFVFHENFVSIVPCLCFATVILIARSVVLRPPKKRFDYALGLAIATFLLFTLSSVPTLRSWFHLDIVWSQVNNIWFHLESYGAPWWLWVMCLVAGFQIGPIVVWFLFDLLWRSTRWRWAIRLRFAISDMHFREIYQIAMPLSAKFVFWTLRSRARLGIPDVISGGVLRGHWLWEADLSGCTFRNADLEGTHFINANLTTAIFDCKELRRVSFYSADLSSANFCRATLVDCNFSTALLADAVFADAVFNNSNLMMARYSRGTVFPHGFEIPSFMLLVK